MKTGKTFVEKILNAPAGSIVFRAPDIVMSHDNSARIGKLFEKLKGEKVLHPEKLVVVMDRKMTGTTDELIRDYNGIHRFMQKQEVEHFFDCDKGICHEVLAEYLKEGLLLAGNDSHTCTAGAFNCLAVGLNKTETAMLWKSGEIWFRVPETVKITLKNSLREGVYAKDLALWVTGMLKGEMLAYQAVEYHGEGVHTLSIADRMTLANVASEIGVMNIVFPPDDTLADYFGNYAVQGVWADENALYSKEFEVDLAEVTPMVMSIGEGNKVKGVKEWGPLAIQQGLIGACACGRLEDIRVVARILEGQKITPGFQLSIVPASRAIYLKAIEEGLIDKIFKAGASILGASCAPCLGSSYMMQADTKRFITTTLSHSMRRMTTLGVDIYIASPATVAMTALKGCLSTENDEKAIEYPYQRVSIEPVTVEEYDNRLFKRIWNYADIDHISCEQLFAEQWTYHISIEDGNAMIPHLLMGLDMAFAGQVKTGDILLGGENFGRGELIKHATIGLVAAGIKAVIVKSVDRNFFRMASNQGLLVVIAPALVAKYRPGDTIEIDIENGHIYLNQEEYILPKMDTRFIQMVKKGGIFHL
ncbi:MAG: aconitase family protein [Odoribacter sp.]